MTIPSLVHSKIKTVIFDLDGTLIESAPSILIGLEFAIKKSGLFPTLPLDSSLVGPPLKDILDKIVGGQLNVDLDILMADFKSYYDADGFKESKPYPGVRDMVNQLTESNISLYLATNKRLKPTLKIIDYFGWASLFDGVYAIDKFPEAPFSNKASMIRALIQAESIEKAHAVYVGDRNEDFEASAANGIDAILVNWGYCDFQKNPATDDAKYADSPGELYRMIVGRQ
jgi:phosphoglycolate phosphatase